MTERALARGYWSEEGSLLIGMLISVGLLSAIARAAWRLIRRP